VNTWTAVYEYDPEDKMWLVHADEDDRCHTWGRTIAEARRHIRDAAALWAEHPVDITDRILPPPTAAMIVGDYLSLREKLDELTDELSVAQMNAAGALRQAGLSMREAAAVLGISHQRVGQLSKRIPWDQVKSKLGLPS
jgi:predicted RNase H-like HicB family nuclease